MGDCGSLVAADDVSSTLNDRDERLACHCSTSLPICARARAASSGDGGVRWVAVLPSGGARRRGRDDGVDCDGGV